jgi:GNAT superfamily N-acetyltransferase
MEVHSLGYRTDLIFPAFDGEILDRGDYLVVRTPSNPTYYWGNFLLFSAPPKAGDYARWTKLFVQEIGSPPQVEHQVFGWDSVANETGLIQPFLENGFHLLQSVVLSARQVHPPFKSAAGVVIRPLDSEAGWQQAVENQVACRDSEFSEPGYRLFRQRQMDRYRAMADAGLGAWFGAFAEGWLVADLGIFHSAQLGRYQSVQTHPDYRRRGIAGRLVYESAKYAFTHFGIDTLVIMTEAESPAERLYKSLGFQPVEHQVGLEKWDEVE